MARLFVMESNSGGRRHGLTPKKAMMMSKKRNVVEQAKADEASTNAGRLRARASNGGTLQRADVKASESRLKSPGTLAAARPSPSIAIFDRDAVLRQLRLATSGGEYLNEYDVPVMLSASADEQTRIERLRVLAGEKPLRPLIVSDAIAQMSLEDLKEECPGFVDVIAIVERAVALSAATNTGIAFPPLLLAGPPGLGKTHFARRLALALGLEQHAFNCATNSDAQALLIGHPPTWRGARMGVLTEAMLGGESGNPLIVLDELDKFITHSTEKPFNSLLALLEPENAVSLVDEFLRVPFNLSNILIVATANDVDVLPDFIRDRFMVLPIAPPEGAMLRAISSRIAIDIITAHGGAFAPPDEEVVARLAKANPRAIRRIVSLALGFAAQAGRNHLTVADVDAARASTGSTVASGQIGFLRPRRET